MANMVKEQNQDLSIYVLDGVGGCKEVESLSPPPSGGTLWVHLASTSAKAQKILKDNNLAPPLIIKALTDKAPQARMLHDEGLLIVLRGVNLNPNASPEDMVSVRVWMKDNLIVTVCLRKVMAIEDLKEELLKGVGVTTKGQFLAQLSNHLINRMDLFISSVLEKVEDVEEIVLGEETMDDEISISDIRRQLIKLKRHLSPQKEVLFQLSKLDPNWISELDQDYLQDSYNVISNYLVNIEAAKERAAVVQDEMKNDIAERMNQTMYTLSVFAAVFLPLGFLTGLLGINVAGIPGSEYPYAFLLVCLMLTAISGLQIYIFKRMKWL